MRKIFSSSFLFCLKIPFYSGLPIIMIEIPNMFHEYKDSLYNSIGVVCPNIGNTKHAIDKIADIRPVISTHIYTPPI